MAEELGREILTPEEMYLGGLVTNLIEQGAQSGGNLAKGVWISLENLRNSDASSHPLAGRSLDEYTDLIARLSKVVVLLTNNFDLADGVDRALFLAERSRRVPQALLALHGL